MMEEPENAEPIDGGEEETGDAEGSAPKTPQSRRKVPKPGQLEDKWYMVGWQRQPSLEVTVTDSQTKDRGAQAGLVGRLLEKIEELIEQMGGGVKPVLAGALSEHSITILLDDPQAPGPQESLPVEFTLVAATRIQRLIDLDGDDLFAAALEIGPEAMRYVEFVHLVETSGISLTWTPRGQKGSELETNRASQQYARLTVEPALRETEMTLVGLLYRVIADPSKIEGSIGIKLAKESSRPPWHKGGSWVNVFFVRDMLEEAIKDGLIGEWVEARVRLTEPVPGTGLSTDARRVELVSVSQRPTPLSITDLLTDDDDKDGA
jgi:hypothetical protein